MREHETRKERHDRKIMLFLASDAETLPLRLYGHEIDALSKHYPQIKIEQKSQFKDTKLFDCIFTKSEQ